VTEGEDPDVTTTEATRGQIHAAALAYSDTEAAQVLGLGRTTTRQLIREGKLRSVRVGRRLLVPRRAIEEYLAGLLEG
jgi:excisionase family DNA binding protein